MEMNQRSKYRESMIKKFGSEEAYLEWRRNISIKGGKKSGVGGFGTDKVGKDGLTGRERAAKYGKKH